MNFQKFLKTNFLKKKILFFEFIYEDCIISSVYNIKNDELIFSSKIFSTPKKVSKSVKEKVLNNSKYSKKKNFAYLRLEKENVLIFQKISLNSSIKTSLFFFSFYKIYLSWKKILFEIEKEEFAIK